MVQGGMSCIKYILFVFNFIFVLFGGLLIYSGVIMFQDNSQSFSQILEAPTTLAISVIILGFLISLIAFLGCCGALFESHCILLTFGIIVTVILALELSIAGLAFAFKSDVRHNAASKLRIAVQQYNWTNPGSQYSRWIDQMQSTLRCCGINSTSDWIDLNPNPADSSLLPDSCCPRSTNHSDGGPSLRETLLEPSSAIEWPGVRQSGKCHAPGILLSNRPGITGGLGPAGASGSNNFDFDAGNSGGGGGNAAAGFAGRNSNSDGFSSSSSSSSSGEAGKELAPFSNSCVDVFVDAMIGLVGPIGLVCMAVAIFQLLGITFAFCLSKAVRREYQVV